jgi:TolA-binding protein
LDNVRQTLEGVRIDKWKRGSIRDEADGNITTIQRDLQGTLPSLMKTADDAPTTISKVLPVSRNVDALYDVLVHIVEAARVIAPGDQVSQLQSALDKLEKARVKLDEQLEQTAASQEKQLSDLRNKIQAQAAQLHAAATPPPASACPAPAPVKKKKPATTAKKPAASTTNPSSSGSTTTKPQ